jgi:hypothetical protein
MLQRLETYPDNDTKWNDCISLLARRTESDLLEHAQSTPEIKSGILRGVTTQDIHFLPSETSIMALGITCKASRTLYICALPTQCVSAWVEDAWFELQTFPFADRKGKHDSPKVHGGFLDMLIMPGKGTGQLTWLDFWCHALCFPLAPESPWSRMQRTGDRTLWVQGAHGALVEKTYHLYLESLLWTWISFRDQELDRLSGKGQHPVQYRVAGMSLGAALAALSCALPCRISSSCETHLFGFGGPCFGNEAMVQLVQSQVASISWYANPSDPVPRILQDGYSEYVPVSLPLDPSKVDPHRKSQWHRYYFGVDFFCSQQAMTLAWRAPDSFLEKKSRQPAKEG